MKEIPLTQGQVAIVDDEDYERVNAFRWHAAHNGRHTYYAKTKGIKGVAKLTRMHRYILDAPAEMVVDHINGNGLDNRRCNLRVCTIAENIWNSPFHNRGGSSKYSGVAYCKQTNHWKAEITHHGKRIWLGRYPSEIDAARAVDQALITHRGPFAVLNFPERES